MSQNKSRIYYMPHNTLEIIGVIFDPNNIDNKPINRSDNIYKTFN